MSVFVVSPGHIDVLLHALSQYGIVAPDLDVESLRALGENLWHENFVSFNACGGENVEVPHYELRTTDATLDPLAVLSASGLLHPAVLRASRMV
ncbi:MAG TPA: hypothetical protein VFG15_03000 [Amycolatopsis sp.]|nr:hypothetical protein [Amycolatopsis sp.]